MRFAAFECSTERCSVALSIDGEVRSIEQDAGSRAGEAALPMLRELLQSGGIGIGSLDAVAFGAGPGAFTGVRIACALAQGIAAARDIPVLGVSTLEALAEDSGESRVFACLDARMHEVYAAFLERGGQQAHWKEHDQAVCTGPGRVAVPSSARAGGGWTGCGSGFVVHEAALRDALGPELVRVRPQVWPTAAAIARLAAPRFAAGEGVDPSLAAPTYLRDKVAMTSTEQRALRAAAGNRR